MTNPPTTLADQTITLEEFQRMPEENEHLVELVRGRVIREPRPGAQHGQLTVRLGSSLHAHVRERELGIVLADFGVVLSVDPPTVRGPDIAFIAAENLPPEGAPVGFWPGGPDLAVEILSPSNRAAEIREKVLEYLAAGSGLVWVVEPRGRSVTTYRSRTDVRTLTVSDTLEGGDVLPGFRLPISEIFAPPDFPQ